MRTLMMAGIGLALGAAGASAQVTARSACGAAEAVGSLGISAVECDCVIAPVAARVPWQFWTEPRVVRIERGSPAAARLRVGDVITHVNGRRLTSEAGARALATLRPNQTVTLTIRRGDRTLRQAIRSTAACANDPNLLGATPATQRVLVSGQTVAEASRVPTRTAPGAVTSTAITPATAGRIVARPAALPGAGGPLPSGWIGIAFSCSDCSYTTMRQSQAGVSGYWTFTTPPEVYSVETGSPAYRAGIRRGDVLTHVGGQLITSSEGGRRWAQIRPGEKVRLRYRRGHTVRSATVTAAAPPGITATAIRPGQAPQQLKELEATLATVDRASHHLLQETERSRADQARREATLARLQAAQQARLRELMTLLQRAETPEARRRAEELLQALARDQERLAQQQEGHLVELRRANRAQAERLQASRDSIGRAVTALSGVYAAAAAEQQRLRYSGTFGGTDIEVRSVIPIVVTETPTEVTIRAGDTVVTLKRTRQ